ncbi:hypothetical protein [Solimonas terrae]|uniref:hypothetical protein n=1 Tax=Solimonas terrae TaxID=1396819 RepID=UPI001581B58A|nr:hypothetical protein [Solimonas terrae]
MNTVFIHTNPKQRIGAEVARFCLKRNSGNPDAFDVRIISTADTRFLLDYEGREYLREGRRAVWRNDDLQSFTPLRFAVPELMDYSGRAIVMDPDVFAIGDINELLNTDMGGAAIMARRMEADFRRPGHYASSVMLLDCARLRHWQLEADFAKLFAFERDYRDWMWLLLEPEGSVAAFASVWNDFDRLAADTRLLHNTHRRTQPWKTGLPADFTPRGTTVRSRLGLLGRSIGKLVTGKAGRGHYRRHPDIAQERFFFARLGECMENGIVSPALIEQEIGLGHLRKDALQLAYRTMSATPQASSTTTSLGRASTPL